MNEDTIAGAVTPAPGAEYPVTGLSHRDARRFVTAAPGTGLAAFA